MYIVMQEQSSEKSLFKFYVNLRQREGINFFLNYLAKTKCPLSFLNTHTYNICERTHTQVKCNGIRQEKNKQTEPHDIFGMSN